MKIIRYDKILKEYDVCRYEVIVENQAKILLSRRFYTRLFMVLVIMTIKLYIICDLLYLKWDSKLEYGAQH